MTPTKANSARRPVAGKPDNIQSISTMCVKRITVSSTLRSSPKVCDKDVRQEFIGEELMRGSSTYSPYAGRNDEHIRMLGYRREGRIGIFEHEFGVGVLLPGRQHLLLIGR
jgi:hypothetical protein